MNKTIRDGKVAVIYSPGFGAGWVTWHGVEQLMYDPNIVDMLEREDDPEKILNYCQEVYGEEPFYGGVDQLTIYWLDEGTEFFIDEYDGAECITTKDSIPWQTA